MTLVTDAGTRHSSRAGNVSQQISEVTTLKVDGSTLGQVESTGEETKRLRASPACHVRRPSAGRFEVPEVVLHQRRFAVVVLTGPAQVEGDLSVTHNPRSSLLCQRREKNLHTCTDNDREADCSHCRACDVLTEDARAS